MSKAFDRGPPGGPLVWTSFCLWESHCVYHLGARSDRLPPFSVRFWYNPNGHMNYSNYL